MKFRSILNAVFIVFVITVAIIFVRIEILDYNRQQSDVFKMGLNVEYEARLDWPDQRSFQIDLDSIHHDSYIYLELSNNDTYALEFVNTVKDHTHTLVINSYDWAWYYVVAEFKPIMQLIPAYIVEDGYDQINIKIIGGDAQYAVRDVQLRESNEIESFGHYVNVIDFEVKQLEIFIDKDDYRKLEEKREEALLLNILITEDGDEVDATFISVGETSKGSIRLKGDWTDHLMGDKWSFRIDLKSDYAIYGMSEFSVQDPETRLGLREPVLYDFYRSEGCVALRYDFLDVFVNGIYKGVYAYEEFFTSDMVEASEKRDGPIIKANEEIMWQSFAFDFSNSIFLGDIETFKYSTSIKTEARLNLSEYAINLYQEYKAGNLSIDQAFDIELLAKYHAIEDIFAAVHGSRVWHNVRFYLNPITLKLEPIPFDELSFVLEDINSTIGSRDFDVNKEYYNLYLQFLHDYSVKLFIFLQEHDAKIYNWSLMLSRDNSYIGGINFLEERIMAINNYLSNQIVGERK